jgi:hypothetical protein
MILDGANDPLTKVYTATVSTMDMQGVLGRDLTPEEKDMLLEFEQSWKYFTMSKKGNLPMGKEEDLFLELRKKQAEEEEAKRTTTVPDTVQTELDNQIRIFQEGLAQMEAEYKKMITNEQKETEMNQKKLESALQAIIDADKLQTETLPWAFFVSCVDAEAMKQHYEVSKTRAMKPSTRALYLVSTTSEGTNKNDQLIDALQMDHALLKAQLRMLNKEIQRYEKTGATQELLAKFMVANNIWNILK